jgi:transposase-like protein
VVDTGGMSKTQEERHQWWRQLVAQQEQSGLSVRAFCQQHRTNEPSFYQWRKRLAARLPVKFALVETGRNAPARGAAVELTLPTGERLRIEPGVEAATLRVVLGVLREPR